MTRQLVLVLMMASAVAFGPGFPAVHTQAPASPSASGDGSQEGIKVHGHWTIVVLNHDGTVASRGEYKNALVAGENGGPAAIAAFLSDFVTESSWRVHFSATAVIPQITATRHVPTAPINNFPFPTGTVELTGQFTAAEAADIFQVDTRVNVAFEAGGVTGARDYAFSRRSIDRSIRVVAGQIVQFKVVFSFS